MNGATQVDEWTLQNSQYEFPYHHTPHFERGAPRISRSLGWGLEYLCYLHHARYLIEGLRPSSVLDVGCGDGRLLSELNSVDRRVGADLSIEAIRFARAFAPGGDFHAMNAADLEETFDVVSAIEVLEHVPDDVVPDFLCSIGERVAPGGHLVISVPTTARPCHPKHYRHYSSELLRSQIQEHLKSWTVVREDHIFADTLPLKLFQKFSVNRYWTLDVPFLSKLVWSHIWRRRARKQGAGVHLMIIVRRPA